MADVFRVEGAEFLEKALQKLGAQFYSSAGRQVIRGALTKSTRPTMQLMRAAAPRGFRSHRSHKGRLLPPGYLQRSIRANNRIDRRTGNIVRSIGVLPEAFYGVQFVPYGITRGGRNTSTKDWFVRTFKDQEPRMAKAFNNELIPEVERVAERIARRQRIKRVGA